MKLSDFSVFICSLQVWAKGAKPPNAGEGDTECKESTWGVGANITTKLVNPAGEVPACDYFLEFYFCIFVNFD